MQNTASNEKLISNFQFSLNHTSGVPYYRQIIKQVEVGIAAGRLSQGTQLPTVRQLAVDLQINPNTVTRAYNELEIRGIVTAQQGTGTFISGKTMEMTDEERADLLNSLIRSFMANVSTYGFTTEEIQDHLATLRVEDGL